MAVVEYTVFISAKSQDSVFALRVYEFLEFHGLKAFYSERDLPQRGDANYRSAIDDALERSKHCVVITSSGENVRSRWVQAEWGLFINEQRAGFKDGNLIIVLCGEVTARELPISLRQYQAIPLSQLESILPFLHFQTSTDHSSDIKTQEYPGETRLQLPGQHEIAKAVPAANGGAPSTSSFRRATFPLPDVVILFGREESAAGSELKRRLETLGLAVLAVEDAIQPSGLQEDRTFRFLMNVRSHFSPEDTYCR